MMQYSVAGNYSTANNQTENCIQ